jgi:hypothetical protein
VVALVQAAFPATISNPDLSNSSFTVTGMISNSPSLSKRRISQVTVPVLWLGNGDESAIFSDDGISLTSSPRHLAAASAAAMYASWYLQDDWKASRRLTVNLKKRISIQTE